MPITTIDDTAALVILDLQAAAAAAPTIEPVPALATRVADLADASRAHARPVILVRVTGTAPGRTDAGDPAGMILPDEWTQLLPELRADEREHTVTKNSWGALNRTGLIDQLEARGITQIVLTRVSTSQAADSTARAAYDHGLHVTIATDGITDLDQTAHDHALAHTFPRIAETGTIAEIVTAPGA
ncbi:cysteine hydrolase [Amycolatopsis acidiphila]|uniref:Cysteine hydrolase n=1 Tax=Amycolatopsis acidiphila TaxID=715473 RepID=A0A558AIC9_9PSEU|nr:isochorismatase family cysteine hydrolase [Amycolatopsis acidiphila]TVT24020.1 cysteine hydrolase [Amycolatopsis acidiphila]UIJ57835.1 cysteine hydrolase [Amycolatopsis acidiphila]GHG87959.1 hydrolase [Amycolatopsis acidiphila]